MTVVPLKPYTFVAFRKIAGQINDMRAVGCREQWSEGDIWQLWQALFRV